MIWQAFKFDVGHLEANCFMIGCFETREAALIDVGDWSDEIPRFAQERGLTVKTIFITHNHYDHIQGLSRAVERFGAGVVAGTPELQGVYVDRVVKHGDELQIGRHRGRIVDTSGHTPVGLSLILPPLVFTGDALFAGSVGGTSNEVDYHHQLDLIRKNLFTLPGHYEVHCGHGPSSTIEIERTHNPFFV